MRSVRLRHLAMTLSGLTAHPQNNDALEQYATEGDLAARWLLAMHQFGDVEGRTVVDVGAGNGIFGLGAMLLGASSAWLIESDAEVCTVAAGNARSLGIEVAVVHQHVTSIHHLPSIEGCTIISNPPWGVRTTAADRPVLEALLGSSASVLHIMHHADAPHVEAMARDEGWLSEEVLRAPFRLPPIYEHHQRGRRSTEAVCRRLVRR